MLPTWFRIPLWLTLAVVLGSGAALVVAPRGATETLPAADVGIAFTRGYLVGDPKTCDLAAPELAASLARERKARDCASSMAVRRQNNAVALELIEQDRLRTAHEAAKTAFSDHIDDLAYRSVWFGKRFTLPALARAIREADPKLRVRLGNGPAAARRTAENVVVIDAKRSTPKNLVVYGESSSGAIWRLTGRTTGKPSLARTTVRGVVTPFPPARLTGFAMAAAAPTDPTLVVITVRDPKLDTVAELLVGVGPDGLVHTMLAGRAVVPPVAGTGSADPLAFAAALTKAYGSSANADLCALVHPALVTLIGDSCTGTGESSVTADVTTPEQRRLSADGTTIVAVSIGSGGQRITLFNLAVPTVDGYRVTGVFVDVGELLALLGQPL